jgi:hypothetical protein
MAKQTLELEVPEGWELTGEYRFSRDGEHFLTSLGKVVKHRLSDAIPRIIVRQDWQWPEWLKAPWIAMDKSGDWFAYDGKPVLGQQSSISWKPQIDSGCSILDPSMYTINLPACEDWTKSLRKNPHLGD